MSYRSRGTCIAGGRAHSGHAACSVGTPRVVVPTVAVDACTLAVRAEQPTFEPAVPEVIDRGHTVFGVYPICQVLIELSHLVRGHCEYLLQQLECFERQRHTNRPPLPTNG